MKLLRLKITDPKGFRSLQPGFELYFLRDWNSDEVGLFNPYVLAGPNGSGKSNVLEVLSAIFYHLECMYLNYRPDSFEYDQEKNPRGFRSERAVPNGFELEYYILAPEKWNRLGVKEYAHIKIIKENKKSPSVYWVNREVFEKGADTRLSNLAAKEVLPEFLLGYSSGENEILSLPFFKMRFIHYDEYKDFLIKQNPYSSPEGRLVFMNNEFSQAIVLSNLLLQTQQLLLPFENLVGLERIKSFRIIIKKYIPLSKDQVTENDQDETRFHCSRVETIADDEEEKRYRVDITQNLRGIIDKLEKCTTCSYYDDIADQWYFDYWVNEHTIEAFTRYFGSALELFQAFQILLTLNLYTVSDKLKSELYQSTSLYVNETVPVLPSDERIMRFKDFWIQKSGVTKPVLSKAFSDGEHQFLHTLGLCLLYKDRNCLFLLDEPETHFNPEWRAKFISSVRECFGDKQSNEREDGTLQEMLITTHSPFLISDSRPAYVLLFDKDVENKTVRVSRPDYNTLGASINKITMMSFGKTETIGGYAEKELNRIKNRFAAGESKEELLDEVNAVLGDSVEKTLFIKKVLASMGEP